MVTGDHDQLSGLDIRFREHRIQHRQQPVDIGQHGARGTVENR